jgi:hypothetical protein
MKRKSKTGRETHHKKFRCEGGTDDPENLVSLTEFEHAEIHAWEFINGGPWFDYRMSEAKSLPLDVQHLVILEMSRRTTDRNRKMIEEGTHPALKEKNIESLKLRQQKRFRDLNGIDKEWESKRLKSLRAKHAEKRVCPHCDITGTGSAMLQWHFENCPKLTGEVRKQKTLTCPHCNLTGGCVNLKRYHFENCKHK